MIATEEIKNIALLQDEVFFLPKVRTENDFPSFVEKILNEYLIKIDDFEDEIAEIIKLNKSKIELLCDALKNSIREYYNGHPSTAFFKFKEGVDIIDQYLWKQKRNFGIADEKHYFCYRAQKSDDSTLYSKQRMFHCPFEKRHKISTKRYSIPGFPCLYLSDSIHACWEELGRPNIETMQVVRFNVRKYRFLEMSMTPKFIAELYKIGIEKINDKELFFDNVLYLIMTWPLMAVCSIKVSPNESNDSIRFIPEYVFPQMLLEWVRMSQDLDGIKYFSSHTNRNELGYGSFINYAIPVKKIKESGWCSQLTYDLPMTKSINWKKLITSNPEIVKAKYSEGNGDLNKKGYYRGLPKILFMNSENGKKEWYVDSIFGKLEVELISMQTEIMKTN